MKIKISILLIAFALILTACQSVVTPAQIKDLEDRALNLENSVVALTDKLDETNNAVLGLSADIVDIKDNMLTDDDLPELGENVFFEDPRPQVFLGDEDVTDLLDTVWIAKSTTGVISFRVTVLDNSLSDEHGGILYIVPSEEFTEQIKFSGYDFYSVGIAQLESTYEEFYREHGMVRWIRLSEDHPLGQREAIVIYSPSYGIFANEPIARGPQIDIVFAVPYDKYDTPWNFYYGLHIVGTIQVFLPQ